jgi:hypothetical protein
MNAISSKLRWIDYGIADGACRRCGLRRKHRDASDCIADLREIICELQNQLERSRCRGGGGGWELAKGGDGSACVS